MPKVTNMLARSRAYDPTPEEAKADAHARALEVEADAREAEARLVRQAAKEARAKYHAIRKPRLDAMAAERKAEADKRAAERAAAERAHAPETIAKLQAELARLQKLVAA